MLKLNLQLFGWNDVKGSENKTQEKAEYFKFVTGDNKFRVLDSEPVTRWTVWLPMANGGKGVSVPIGSPKSDCPVRVYYEANKEANPALKLRKVHSLNIFDRRDNKVKILEKGKAVFDELVELLEDNGDLTLFDVNIIQKGSTWNTIKYRGKLGDNLPDPQYDKESLYNIKEMVKPITQEQLNILLNGGGYGDFVENKDNTPSNDVVEIDDEDMPF